MVRREPPERLRRIVLFALSTVVGLVLLFSYRTSRGPNAAASVISGGGTQPGIVQPDNAGAPSAGPTTSTGTTPSTNDAGTTTVNGQVAQTRWGPVQVQVAIAGGRITDVKALQYPRGNSRDVQINAYALPMLRSQVLAAQSANIDGVSGATVTSDGYISSLQSALDMAHFRK